MHPLCVGLGRWASRYHTKGREAPGLLTPPSPLWGTSLGWWGKGRHTVTRGAPVKTHCSWGEPAQQGQPSTGTARRKQGSGERVRVGSVGLPSRGTRERGLI